MTFSPFFTKYINVAPTSYTAPSSSIGALQLTTLQSNMEWQYHFMNSQVLFTQTLFSSNDFLERVILFPGDAGKTKLFGSIGPFKVNLDKNGNPQPLFLSVRTSTQTNNLTTSLSGQYKVNVRTVGRTGNVSVVEALTFVTSSTSAPASATANWNTLTGSFSLNDISYNYTATGSIFRPLFSVNTPYQLPIRSTQSLTSNDSSQTICSCYLDFYFKCTAFSGGGNGTLRIPGIYLREVNPYEAF